VYKLLIESSATSIQSSLLLPIHYIAVGHENGIIDLYHGEQWCLTLYKG